MFAGTVKRITTFSELSGEKMAVELVVVTVSNGFAKLVGKTTKVTLLRMEMT